LREAATEIGSNEPEISEVKLDDGDPKILSVKEAAKKLQDHHAQQAEDQEAVRKAMGLDIDNVIEFPKVGVA
jgi:hypothetical protein